MMFEQYQCVLLMFDLNKLNNFNTTEVI